MGKLAVDRRGYIVWRGGDKHPEQLDDNTLVKIKLRGGAVLAGTVCSFRWSKSSGLDDIVGYKLVD